MRIQTTDKRERLWNRLKEATGESTVSDALDVAARHYLEDKRTKEELVEEIDDELAAEISTSWLPVERETSVEMAVGRD